MDTSSDSSEWLDSDSDWEPELEGAACKPAAAAAAAAAGGSKAGGVELRAVFGCSRRQPEKESRQPSHKKPVASKKAGCLFELRVEVENGIAEVTERHGHNGHTPGNSEDVRWLPPCAAVVAKIEEYARIGLSAFKILMALMHTRLQHLAAAGQEAALAAAAADEAAPAAEVAVAGSAGAAAAAAAAAAAGAPLNLAAFQGRREVATLRDIQKIVKRMRGAARIDSNDVAALAALVAKLEAAAPDTVLFYVPQKVDAAGSIQQRFRLCLTSPFGLRMLRAFGSELAFMDAVYGLNSCGYIQATLVVRDEYCNAVPVACCIADCETADVFEEFLEAVAKSIEQFCKTAGSGVHGKEGQLSRLRIYGHIIALQAIRDKSTFNVRCAAFLELLRTPGGGVESTKFAAYFEKEWVPRAQYWAAYGREAVRHLLSDTNNLSESSFRMLKYHIGAGKVHRRCTDDRHFAGPEAQPALLVPFWAALLISRDCRGFSTL
ncbi:Ubiquitin-like-specific protease 1 [Micractinium conductrix]|uniref:Ubiquitin-like-specific protease 1 n=1 Tax=Micractinium conductrix TaxID=554055 RepID=A0A2P6VS63_9CHLO|nr:Ubiquitin-like-specific protease 1 [Micractinium conductrix]|eukprot:PSC76900.1 Ubiquitin-like-specific protease 1 [Micractinium conductrix]